MSGVLLDTNAMIWLVNEPEKLGSAAQDAMTKQKVWVSAVSLWEVEIKRSVRRLSFIDDLSRELGPFGVSELSITWAHAAALAEVELPQKDPFDRMIAAQAQVEGLDLLTSDRQILAAGLPFVRDARD